MTVSGRKEILLVPLAIANKVVLSLLQQDNQIHGTWNPICGTWY
jgi:hypothetical protein